jgi:hypothetical protein
MSDTRPPDTLTPEARELWIELDRAGFGMVTDRGSRWNQPTLFVNNNGVPFQPQLMKRLRRHGRELFLAVESLNANRAEEA